MVILCFALEVLPLSCCQRFVSFRWRMPSVVSRLKCRISLVLAAHGVVANLAHAPACTLVLRLALPTDGGAIYRRFKRDATLVSSR